MVLKESRDKARELRLAGHSILDIAKQLGVSKGSVSTWVRDIPLTSEQEQQLKRNKIRWGAQNQGAKVNRQKYLEIRLQYQEQGRIKAREQSRLHLMGCMLYWAEGAKHKNRLYFVNSDPNLMLLYMRFVREELLVVNEDIYLYIHCHDKTQIERIENYWMQLLNIPITCLRKTMIKKGSDTRRNILHNGVCGIGIYKTELVQHVYGAIQEYAGFENPDWLF